MKMSRSFISNGKCAQSARRCWSICAGIHMTKIHNVSRRHINRAQHSRSRDILRKCCEGLERRILLSTTVSVMANSSGSLGGADVTGVTLYDDLNNNGVLDA